MDLFKLVEKRRSVRKFQDKEVSFKDIKKMVKAASMSPSAHNSRPWRFVIIYNRNKIKQISAAVHDSMDKVKSSKALSENLKEKYERYRYYFTFYETAPCLIVVCGKPYQSIPGKALSLAFPKKAKKSPVSSLEQSVSSAVQTFILAATELGYGTCWTTGPLLAADKIKKIIEIPENWIIFSLIPIGLPAKSPSKNTPQDFEKISKVIR